MQGRRVDEALFRDLGEFRLDERSAKGEKEGQDSTECLLNTYERPIQLCIANLCRAKAPVRFFSS